MTAVSAILAPFRRFAMRLLAVALAVVIAFAIACGGNNGIPEPEPNDQDNRWAATIAASYEEPSRAQADALDMMEAVFIGGYSREEIKRRLDIALVLYDLEITEDHYSRAASVLVTLRKENGPQEMEILDYMIRSHVEGVNVTFPSAAALASVFLALGEQ